MLGIDAFGSLRPGMIGCTLRNRSSAQRGDACMRSSRAPSGFLPSDFMLRSPRARDSPRTQSRIVIADDKSRVSFDTKTLASNTS